MKCPECGKELIWNCDFDAEYEDDDFLFISLWSCNDCLIDVTKRIQE